MKNILIVLVLLLNIISCSACEKVQKENDMVEYKTGVFYDKHWDETEGTYTGDAIPDEKTALKIAQAIFDGIATNQTVNKYVPQKVFYDSQDEIWIVSFWENSIQDVLTVGGCCSIAMQKKDGKVLRIWFGE